MGKTRLQFVFGVVLSAAVAGCSSTGGSEPAKLDDEGAAGSGGDGTRGSEPAPPTECETLEQVSTAWADCPDTSDELARWAEDFCTHHPDLLAPDRRLGECGGATALQLDWWTHSQTCLYDADTHELTAAMVTDDVPTFCDHTRASVRAGAWPAECNSTVLFELPSVGEWMDCESEADEGSDCGTLAMASTAWVDCPEAAGDLAGWANDYCTNHPEIAIPDRRIGECGGLTALDLSWGTHRQACLYQPDTLELTAAFATDDVGSFCDGASLSIYGGDWPQECTEETLSEIDVSIGSAECTGE